MFGGNPGGKQGKEDRVRLGDFWRLHLLRPNRREVLRQCEVNQCNVTIDKGRIKVIVVPRNLLSFAGQNFLNDF